LGIVNVNATGAQGSDSVSWTLVDDKLVVGDSNAGRVLLQDSLVKNTHLTFGPESDHIIVASTDNPTTINSGTGGDPFQVGSLALIDAHHFPVSDIGAPLVLKGGSAGDTLTVDNQADLNMGDAGQ